MAVTAMITMMTRLRYWNVNEGERNGNNGTDENYGDDKGDTIGNNDGNDESDSRKGDEDDFTNE